MSEPRGETAIGPAAKGSVPRSWLRLALVLAAYTFAAVLVTEEWSAGVQVKDDRMAFSEVWAGTAHRPFVFRRLVLWTADAATEVLPREWLTSLSDAPGRVAEIADRIAAGPALAPEVAVVYGLWVLSFLAFLLSLRGLLGSVFSTHLAIVDLAPLGVLFFLPMMWAVGTRYYYDPPALALWAACFYSLATHRVLLYYAVLGMAVLNKETAALAPLVFLLHFRGTRSRVWLVGHAALQAAIVLAAVGMLSFYYRDNLGYQIEPRLAWNLGQAMKSLADPSWITSSLFLVLLVTARLGEQPPLLRQALLLVLPLTAAYLYGGFWGEVRVFYEVLPVCYLLALANALHLVGVEIAPTQPR